TDDSRSDRGRLLDQEVRMRIPDAHVMYIDPRDAAGLKQPVMDALEQADAVIAAVYAFPSAGRLASAATVQDASASQLHEIQTYVCTFSNAQVSELSAVQVMFGEIPMPGRLPVTIPNIANRGAGLGGPAPVSTTPASPKTGLAGDPGSSGGPQ